jgi:hypothetical protein
MPVNYYFNLLTALEDFLSRSFTLFPCSYQPFSFYGQLFYSTSIFLWIFVLFYLQKIELYFTNGKERSFLTCFSVFLLLTWRKINRRQT